MTSMAGVQWRAAAAALMLTAVLASSAAAAAARTALPELTLTTLDGKTVKTTDVATGGSWLLVYVRPDCRPCDGVLDAIQPAKHPDVVSRLVIVIATADRGSAARVAAAYPDLAGAQWYVDSGQRVGATLDVHEAPVIAGVAGQTIDWTLAGVLTRGAKVETLMASWIRKGR